MNSGWGAPIKAAIEYNEKHANDTGYEDGYCPECAWPLVTKDKKKVCLFCEWSE